MLAILQGDPTVPHHRPITRAKGYGDFPTEAHGLHYSLGCLLDGHFIFLAHCGESGASCQSGLPVQTPRACLFPLLRVDTGPALL